MADDEPDHVEGVDMTDLNAAFDDLSYPVTADDVVDAYGDLEIERTNAEPITLRELFEPMAADTYGSTDQLRQSVLTLMPKESVGRQRYSDRGLTVDVPGEERRQDRPLPGHERGDET